MSFEVTEAMVQQYRGNIALLSQQKRSVLEPHVRVETIHAEFEYFDQIGTVTAQMKNGRHADTPLMDTPHYRRRVTTSPYNWADMVDNTDRLRMLADPTSPYAQNAVMAFNRQKDKIIIDAAFGDVYTGKEGKTVLSFPDSQTITTAGAVGVTAPTDGLTIEKLLAAREMLWRAEVDESMPLYCVCSARQLVDMLNTTEVKNADYNTVKALAQGQLSSFMGFTFIRSELLPYSVTDTARDCLIYAKDGILLAKAEDITVRVSERADKNYSTQVYVEMDLGGTRMEESKVIKVRCKETM